MWGSQDVLVQDTFVHYHFINKLFDFVHPKKVICEVFDLVCSNHDCMAGFKFGWNYSHSVKKIILDNNFLWCSKIPFCEWSRFPNYIRDFGALGSHVCTADLNFIKNYKLKTFISKGLNLILVETLNPHLAIDALLDCLIDIASKLQLELETHL